MIIDVITYNGEKDLFDIRYNILKDYVDKFIVVEFNKTFSGKSKSFYFDEIFNKYQISSRNPFIEYHKVIESAWSKYEDLAQSSPNTEYGKGAEHWIREFCQKEYIKDCLVGLDDEDIVFIGDCDEIWHPDCLKWLHNPCKLKLLVYTYYLNNLSDEEFWGTLTGKYKDLKNKCLNELRSNKNLNGIGNAGWHFTSLKDGLERKLTDSYTEETHANKQVMDNLEENIKNNKDFLGRDFTFSRDETNWPNYLKENRNKYLHLLR